MLLVGWLLCRQEYGQISGLSKSLMDRRTCSISLHTSWQNDKNSTLFLNLPLWKDIKINRTKVRRTDRKTEGQTYRQKDNLTVRRTDRQKERQKGSLTVRRTDIPTKRQQERMKNSQKDIETDRQKDQQTEGQTYKQRDHRVRTLASLFTIIKNKIEDIF